VIMASKLVHIIGMGHTLGSKMISNEDLSKKLNLTSEQIIKSTGITNRFHCDKSIENLDTLLATAFEQARTTANIPLKDITGIYTSTNPTGYFSLPNTSTRLAKLVGIDEYKGTQIGAGCCGGLQALQAAYNQLIVDTLQGITATYAVVVGDQTSQILAENSTDNILFSDSGAALLLTNNPNVKSFYTIDWIKNTTQTEHADALQLNNASSYVLHDGKKVYRFATQTVKTALDFLGTETFPKDVFLIPHQANKRIITAATKELNPEQVYSQDVERFGNTSPSSTLIGLENVTRQGISYDKLLLLSFGEGLGIYGARLTKNQKNELPEPLPEASLKRNYFKKFINAWGLEKATLETEIAPKHTDSYDHLSYKNHSNYFSDGLRILFEPLGLTPEVLKEKNLGLYVTKYELEPKQQARAGQQVTVQSQFADHRGPRINVTQEMISESGLLAKANTSFCFVNYETGKPISPPKGIYPRVME